MIPTNSLTLLEAKQIGILTYYLFAMMDLTDDGKFSDAKFVGSILGNRLKAWSTLPDSAMIHDLWHKAPLQATYQWFASLQSLLGTKQNWVKQLRYHPTRGFYQARGYRWEAILIIGQPGSVQYTWSHGFPTSCSTQFRYDLRDTMVLWLVSRSKLVCSDSRGS